MAALTNLTPVQGALAPSLRRCASSAERRPHGKPTTWDLSSHPPGVLASASLRRAFAERPSVRCRGRISARPSTVSVPALIPIGPARHRTVVVGSPGFGVDGIPTPSPRPQLRGRDAKE